MEKFTSTYKLYLDDIRMPAMSAKHYPNLSSVYLKEDWVIVRSYQEFVDVVTEKFAQGAWPSFISFDHDLADEHTKFFYENGGWDSPPQPDYTEFKERTGLSAAKWLSYFILDNSLPVPGYEVHSANPVGRENIRGFLNNFKKFYGYEN
jgi:hypothetical protein